MPASQKHGPPHVDPRGSNAGEDEDKIEHVPKTDKRAAQVKPNLQQMAPIRNPSSTRLLRIESNLLPFDLATRPRPTRTMSCPPTSKLPTPKPRGPTAPLKTVLAAETPTERRNATAVPPSAQVEFPFPSLPPTFSNPLPEPRSPSIVQLPLPILAPPPRLPTPPSQVEQARIIKLQLESARLHRLLAKQENKIHILRNRVDSLAAMLPAGTADDPIEVE